MDGAGQIVRQLEGPDRPGIHRVAWDLRYPLTFTATDEDEGWFGPPKGTLVLPGEYTVKLAARGREVEQKVMVAVDPRARTTSEGLRARFDAAQSVADLQRAFTEGAAVVAVVAKDLDTINANLRERQSPAEVTAAVKDFTTKLDDLKERFKAGWGGPKFRIFDLAGQLQASTSAPTDAQLRSLQQLRTEVTASVELLNAVTSSELPALQQKLLTAGVKAVAVKTVQPPKKSDNRP